MGIELVFSEGSTAIAELICAGAGYAIFNHFWPNFYFQPVQAGKNLWLTLQGISIAVYVVRICYACDCIRRASVLPKWRTYPANIKNAASSIIKRIDVVD